MWDDSVQFVYPLNTKACLDRCPAIAGALPVVAIAALLVGHGAAPAQYADALVPLPRRLR
jgi:hypothetical protein